MRGGEKQRDTNTSAKPYGHHSFEKSDNGSPEARNHLSNLPSDSTAFSTRK